MRDLEFGHRVEPAGFAPVLDCLRIDLDNMSKLVDCCDENLTFFALVYRDHDDVVGCLGDLRRHYPTSRVVLRSDGDPDPRLPALAGRFDVDYRGESRLFGIE